MGVVIVVNGVWEACDGIHNSNFIKFFLKNRRGLGESVKWWSWLVNVPTLVMC